MATVVRRCEGVGAGARRFLVKTFTLYPKNTQVLGRFKLCINTYRIDGREMAETEVIPIDMPDSNGEMTWQAKNYTQYSSYFMKITCLK